MSEMNPSKLKKKEFSQNLGIWGKITPFWVLDQKHQISYKSSFLRLQGTSKDFSEAYKYDASTKVTKSEIFRNVGVGARLSHFGFWAKNTKFPINQAFYDF